MAASSARHLSSWTGSPISSRRRGSTVIGITEYSRTKLVQVSPDQLPVSDIHSL
jgi:hypothetical protein